MNTLPHADIFFFVTTICIVILTLLLIIAWAFAMKILGDVKRFTDKARKEGELIIEEVSRIREQMRTRSSWGMRIIRIFRKMSGY